MKIQLRDADEVMDIDVNLDAILEGETLTEGIFNEATRIAPSVPLRMPDIAAEIAFELGSKIRIGETLDLLKKDK